MEDNLEIFKLPSLTGVIIKEGRKLDTCYYYDFDLYDPRKNYQHINVFNLYLTSNKKPQQGDKILHNDSVLTVVENKGQYWKVDELSHIDIRADLCKKIEYSSDSTLGVPPISRDFVKLYVKDPDEIIKVRVIKHMPFDGIVPLEINLTDSFQNTITTFLPVERTK